MVWMWRCHWENQVSDWKDYESYSAVSRVVWRDKKKAEKAAKAHERRTGYKTHVIETDGRYWRGKIR